MQDSIRRLLIHLAVAGLVVAMVGYYAFTPTGQVELTAIQNFVNGRAFSVLNYAIIVAAVGTVAMALLELIKALGDVLRWYHEWKLRQWITNAAAFDDLLYLAIGDRARTDALCGQPIEKMMGQIQAAANVALDFPDQHQNLYAFLTTTDVPAVVAPPSAPRKGVGPGGEKPLASDRARQDREAWLIYVSEARARRRIGAGKPPDEHQLTAAKTRIRLSNLATRKLDAFQLRTKYYWDRSNQLAGVVASVGVMYYALYLQTPGEPLTLQALLLGLLSGAIAPFAKDLSKNLSQFAKTP